MEAIIGFVGDTIGFIFSFVILLVMLGMLIGYFGLPVIGAKMAYQKMSETVERSGTGVYLIWGVTAFAFILAMFAVQAVVSLIAMVTSSGDPLYLNNMFIDMVKDSLTLAKK